MSLEADRRRARRVLEAFITGPEAELSGADLTKRLRLSGVSLYGLLHQLEESGYLSSRWEMMTPRGPRRRLYRITDAGRENHERGEPPPTPPSASEE